MNDMVRRIRWGNVARIGAVGIAAALVVAWPKLKSEPLALPPPATLPAAQPTQSTAAPSEQPQSSLPSATTHAPQSEPRPAANAKHKASGATRDPVRRTANKPKLSTPIQPPDDARPRPARPDTEPRERPEFEPFG